jgi:hypothetical protein
MPQANHRVITTVLYAASLKKGVRYLFSLTGRVRIAPDGNPVVDLHAASQPPGYHHGAPSRDTLARLPIPATAIIILSG